MRTIEINAFKFEELGDNIKEKVLDANRDIIHFDEDNEIRQEMFSDILYEDAGIQCREFYWDIYRGDFSMKDATICDVTKCLDFLGLKKWLILKELSFNNDEEKQTFYDELTNNIHLGARGEVFELDEDLDLEDENPLTLKLRDFLKELIEEYDYSISDEAIIEYFKLNEYEFKENGEVI